MIGAFACYADVIKYRKIMFRPAVLYIGLRYTRAKRRNQFISFISALSMIGIALGVAVLITVLSVMNGFDAQIKKRVFVVIPQISVTSITGSLNNWQNLQQRLHHAPQILGVAPQVSGQALLTANGETQAALVTGIDPKAQQQVSSLSQHMQAGSFAALKPHSYGIVIGSGMALHFGLRLGSHVIVVTPSGNFTPVGFTPRLRRFTVVGIFHIGNGFNFDNGFAYINLHDAQALYQLGNGVNSLSLKIADAFAAPQLSYTLPEQLHLPPTIEVNNWTQQLGAFFHAVAMEKHMMFLILLLIIAVAAFNLVSTLVMVVNEKQSDIAILRTIGATPSMIMKIFMVQGVVVGSVGTLIGIVGGIVLALNVTTIVEFLQKLLGIQFINSSVYIVDYLPSQIQSQDVVTVAVVALCLSFVATLYPAWRAARIQPVEALRYE